MDNAKKEFNSPGLLFEKFVLSVLRQKCMKQNKPFYSVSDSFQKKYKYPNDFPIQNFDGYAPEGFDEFECPVIVEIKSNPRNMLFRNLSSEKNIVTLYIVQREISGNERIIGNNVYIWGYKIIEKWKKEFPIDDYTYFSKAPETITANENDFEEKSKSNFELLLHKIEQTHISIALGAGVSCEYGSKNWNELIQDFYNELHNDGKIDNIQTVKEKIGGSNVIDGQFAKDNLSDFMGSLYKGLYCKFANPIQNYRDTSLSYIADFIRKHKSERNFYVITYNYDDYLEQELNCRGIQFNTIYLESQLANDKISIYHPHGFLPYNANRSQFTEYQKSIIFSESEYHRLYNNPYSWAVVAQMFLLRENVFLFVGSSLSDPNLRRILELTYTKEKVHFAFMLKDALSLKDQLIIYRHFSRLGVELIWVNNVNDLKIKLKQLLR